MDHRLILHDELCRLLGSRNVYFQPPENVKLNYPCIIYERSTDRTNRADDRNYIRNRPYTLTLIYKDPDCRIGDRVLEHFNKCSMERNFRSDNLYHTVFRLFYGR